MTETVVRKVRSDLKGLEVDEGDGSDENGGAMARKEGAVAIMAVVGEGCGAEDTEHGGRI